jgi:TetR/AcrR family transcriptional regulator, transcriptional repressor for nem operon
MGRRKQFDPEAAVDEAMALFWRKGYGATTPQDLVDHLGIGKGSLYETFQSKRELFSLALQRYADSRVAAVAQILEKPGPVKDRLRTALLKLAHGRGDPPLRGCMAVNTAVELGDSDPEARKAAKAIFDRLEGIFVNLVKEGQTRGEIAASGDPQQIASFLLNTVLGLQVLGRTSDAPARSRRIIEFVLATL